MVKISPTYDSMSKQAAEDMLSLLENIDRPVICTASGASPTGLYKQLVTLILKNGIDISDWFFVGLDEWKGMNADVEGSSRQQLNHQLFNPLKIDEEQICFFDGTSENPEKECERVEQFIEQHGGLNIAILGIGINGHIAMNEPGTPSSMRSHVAAIHKSTQEIGQKYFKVPTQLDQGLTIGLATLLEATYLFLLASGNGKAESIYHMLHDPVSETFPATLLKSHSNLNIYLDAESSRLIKDNGVPG